MIREMIIVSIGWLILILFLVRLNKGKHLLNLIDNSESIEFPFLDKNEIMKKIQSLPRYKIVSSNEDSMIICYRKNIFDVGINIGMKFSDKNIRVIVRSALFNSKISKTLEEKIVNNLRVHND